MKNAPYILVFCLLIMLSCFSQSAQKPPTVNRTIDSLMTLVKTAKEDTNLAYNLNTLSKELRMADQNELALEYAKKAFSVSEKLKFKNGIATSYNNMGLVYKYQGKYPEALKDQLASLKIREDTGDKKGIASCYGNIGNIYLDMGNYSDGLKNHSRCLKIMQEIHNKFGVATAYNNLGIVYRYQKKYPEAVQNYVDALNIYKAAGFKQGMAGCYNNIGNIYHNMNMFNEALKNFNAALKIREETKDKTGICASSINIGVLYLGENKYADAKRYFKRGLDLAAALGERDYVQEGHKGLAQVDSAEGNYRSALDHYKLFIIYRDSLLNEENTKKTVREQMQYDFDKKTTADSIQNAEKKKQDDLKHYQEIKQQKIYTYGGVIGFILMMVVAGVSFRAFKNKQKANEIISQQKELVEEKQKEILDSIHYAKRIQRSLLPTEKYIQKNFMRLKKQ